MNTREFPSWQRPCTHSIWFDGTDFARRTNGSADERITISVVIVTGETEVLLEVNFLGTPRDRPYYASYGTFDARASFEPVTLRRSDGASRTRRLTF
ncbi:hypothetical protein [Haloferax volcanii]|uniref:hypothetical protein n=1 Tax=Haloferax volcanii TaxID=2246 RepID=UPI001F35A017|nr:hypothetical protein [Haloferax volcanii]MDW7538087.1 hypothetical protein [Haloferax volcanii]